MTHPFEPVYDEHARVLILGSFPSVKSRETGFYYGHPRNRFWQVTAGVLSDAVPKDVPEKRAFLLRHGIAVWDVARQCEIVGSADSSMKQVAANDIAGLLQAIPVERLFANGQTAGGLYRRLVQPTCGREITVLPSTSPANAAFSLEKLMEEWAVIRDFYRKNC